MLALMMLIVLPLSAFAENKFTVTAKTGSEIGSLAKGMDELMGAFSMEIYHMEDAGKLIKLLVSGNDLVTLEVAADEEALYFTSNLVNQKTYTLSWEKADNLIKTYGGEEAVASLQALPYSYKDLFLKPDEILASLTVKTLDEYIAQLEIFQPEIAVWVKDLFARAQTEAGSYKLEGADQADTKMVVNVTPEDIKSFLNLKPIRSTFGASTLANLDKNMEKVANSIKIDVTFYLANDEVVGAEGDVRFTADDSQELNMVIKEYRLTHDGVENHQVSAEITGTPEELNCQIKGNLGLKGTELVDSQIAALISGVEFTFVVKTAQEGETQTSEYFFYLRENAVNIIDIAASASPVIALKVVKEPLTEKPAFHLNKADASDITEQDSLKEISSAASVNATSLLFTLFSSLPPEAMNLLTILPE